MRKGSIIKFNGGNFEITKMVGDEIIKIKRVSDPQIEVDVYHYENKLSVYGWKHALSFELITL